MKNETRQVSEGRCRIEVSGILPKKGNVLLETITKPTISTSVEIEKYPFCKPVITRVQANEIIFGATAQHRVYANVIHLWPGSSMKIANTYPRLTEEQPLRIDVNLHPDSKSTVNNITTVVLAAIRELKYSMGI